MALPLALSTLLLSAAPAFADAPTPHLDTVERSLRQVSPGLEGSVWERTSGNRLGASTPRRFRLAAADPRLLG
ncbi:hypothetical protein [Streptomyces sp. NPDC056069]|uniref:hypothetical protein n=1 Tax=Streptomyces sp. NPDC056069 TaxID=3345702 RepID=UPI0035DDE743